MYGSFDQDLTLHFCTKTVSSLNPNKPQPWAVGSYCLFKKNSCPGGFLDASIFIDDEDNSNANQVNGTLPSGTFGVDTLYDLCCRNDGDPDEGIVLPVHKPFFLLPVSNKCQKVVGMRSEMHWITFDAENNRSRFNGHIQPLGVVYSDGNIKLYFCFYTKQITSV
jgi:hypothetical protein